MEVNMGGQEWSNLINQEEKEKRSISSATFSCFQFCNYYSLYSLVEEVSSSLSFRNDHQERKGYRFYILETDILLQSPIPRFVSFYFGFLALSWRWKWDMCTKDHKENNDQSWKPWNGFQFDIFVHSFLSVQCAADIRKKAKKSTAVEGEEGEESFFQTLSKHIAS